MTKVKEDKVSKKDLALLQTHVSTINQMKAAIGDLVSKSYSMTGELNKAQDAFQKFSEGLEHKYGKVSISVDDGSYVTLNEDDGTNTEN
jgi:hypothetical protein